ncbi:MAG: HAD-IIB family hydrolase [Chloroflexi bacterium]|nr:HAD-IIB family hydrolase [Chloroflexota bacterium]
MAHAGVCPQTAALEGVRRGETGGRSWGLVRIMVDTPRCLALVSDYDGTLATDGQVDEATLAAVRRFSASGRILILVTGRRLDDLLSVFPDVDAFDLVVAENGALLYWPSTGQQDLLGEPPSRELIARLRERRVMSLSVGRSIVATVRPYDEAASEVLRELGLQHQVIFNKGSVMILPAGVDKRSGLLHALDALDLVPGDVVGVGDAENDLPFLLLGARSAAVANALPIVKEQTSLALRGARGAGVVELIDRLLSEADGRLTEPARRRLAQNTAARQSRASRLPVAAGPSDLSVVVVANRGPRDFVWDDHRWTTRMAAGGLVSLLSPLARRPDVAWFCCVSEPPDAHRARGGLFTTAADQQESRLHVVPVPLPADIYQQYYGQISNEVLWMLQHQLIGTDGYQCLDARRHLAWNRGYLEANRRLAGFIRRRVTSARSFLIQDYHLYPLPGLLRESFPRTPIAHFTHIPFPDVPALKLLPKSWRDTILRGLLGADVVGLQTQHDVQAFLSCCADLLGAPVDRDRAMVEADDGREVAVRAYPASVDPRALRRTMRVAAVAAARDRLMPDLEPLSIIRVDRLDPSKNHRTGFLAFARLLEMRPDLRGQLQFVAFLVPSRTDLGVYRAYRDAIYRQIEEINDRFTPACGRPPIVTYYTNDREQDLAAMERCDALLVNSLEDGMNLVAKEWAVVSKRPGVLIVSETTGVAHEAVDSALLVSPLDVEGTAQAMAQALTMNSAERSRRLARFRKRVEGWTASDWLRAQLVDLSADEEIARPPSASVLVGAS